MRPREPAHQPPEPGPLQLVVGAGRSSRTSSHALLQVCRAHFPRVLPLLHPLGRPRRDDGPPMRPRKPAHQPPEPDGATGVPGGGASHNSQSHHGVAGGAGHASGRAPTSATVQGRLWTTPGAPNTFRPPPGGATGVLGGGQVTNSHPAISSSLLAGAGKSSRTASHARLHAGDCSSS